MSSTKTVLEPVHSAAPQLKKRDLIDGWQRRRQDQRHDTFTLPQGLDAFVDELTDGPPVILADMRTGAGQVTYDWFANMYPDVSEAGIVFAAIGIVTSDPASVESVRAWAPRLQRRTSYL